MSRNTFDALVSAARCPDVATHQPPPDNMNQQGYSPTHKQVRCPTCGFWSLWVRRDARAKGSDR